MDTVIFYCGAHKTASSMIRKYLDKHQTYIEDAFRTKCFNRRTIKSNPFFNVINAYSKGKQVSQEKIYEGKKSFLKLIASVTCRQALLHNEDFFSPLFFTNSDYISAYLKYISKELNRKIIIYTRNQADYIESWYIQLIHRGRTIPFSEFYESLQLSDFSWLRVLNDISQHFYDNEIYCMPYESIQEGSLNYINEFFKVVFGQPAELFDYNLESENRSYSGVALKIALASYPYLTDPQIKKLRGFLQTHFSTRTHDRPILLSDDERKQLIGLHEKDNIKVFQRHMPSYDPVMLGYANKV